MHLTPWPNLCSAFSTTWELLRDGPQFLRTISRSRAALAAEILFLRRQLAYYQTIGSDHADSATPPGCAGCFGLACSIGRQRWWSSRRVLSFVGIAKVSSCTDAGSREVAAALPGMKSWWPRIQSVNRVFALTLTVEQMDFNSSTHQDRGPAWRGPYCLSPLGNAAMCQPNFDVLCKVATPCFCCGHITLVLLMGHRD